MNILVLGSGGRECAIARSISQSPLCDELFVTPGNGGTARFANNAPLDINDGDAVVAFAKEHEVEFVVIGPEAPLVAGVADAVRAAGIACFGPGADGARIEGSKDFAKKIMEKYDLPTAAYGTFDNAADAIAYVEKQGAPIVVKADGLAAGKGVTVAATQQEAIDAINECFEGRFGAAGALVVVEECLTGPECSMLAVTDGSACRCLDPSQDHKRVGEGDTGPNTGGMGVYSPVPVVDDALKAEMTSIMERSCKALASEGIDYRGCLYGGFMLTPQGPKLLEFNARFGDPETEILLPRMASDLCEILYACAVGKLAETSMEWKTQVGVSVVLASDGYPGSYETGKLITGIEDAEALEGITVYEAGVKMGEDGKPYTSGGRVLNVSALGEDFVSARELAYKACDLIDFENKYLRRDIAMRALQ